ncbi:hypothetical protein GTO89_14835 [Heliobacterium gestii]|uniref:Phage late control D family protein n=1 Tax=Heliomicrobium gestii TaxID=2699 RepID=A0A845LDP2_HELGE|nr:contractile injection system protein, VgrG/Pvc8 family [Heliomicrobium gestii]MBM7868042.1 phage protein D [Heliomicrobium gestii]MZP44308.1 hypothetical protein [Heliomicrobium gestii]
MDDLALDQTTYEFSALEGKYSQFMAPAFKILVKGVNLQEKGMAISQIFVDTSMDSKADSVSFDIVNAFKEETGGFQWVDEHFALGNTVEVHLGYVDKLRKVFYGLLTKVEFSYTVDDIPRLTVVAMDHSFLMMKGAKTNCWQDKKHSEVAKLIGAKYLSEFQIDDTSQQIPFIVQSNLEDFRFLAWMAGENDYDFFVKGRTLYFQKRFKNTTPVMTLALGRGLHSLTMEANLSSQVSKVIVRGWCEQTHTIEEGTAEEIQKLGSGKTSMDMIKLLGDYTTEYVQANVASKDEATKKAGAILNRRAMQLLTGEGETVGLPELQAGRYIKFEGLGNAFTNPFYLHSVSHSLNESGFVTQFGVRGNVL